VGREIDCPRCRGRSPPRAEPRRGDGAGLPLETTGFENSGSNRTQLRGAHVPPQKLILYLGPRSRSYIRGRRWSMLGGSGRSRPVRGRISVSGTRPGGRQYRAPSTMMSACRRSNREDAWRAAGSRAMALTVGPGCHRDDHRQVRKDLVHAAAPSQSTIFGSRTEIPELSQPGPSRPFPGTAL